MKFLLIISIILLLPTVVLAQEINFLQESHIPKETLQAEILIPNLVSELSSKNIKITDESDNEIKIGFLLKKLTEEYYFIYFDLPENLQDGSYNLIIKDITYNENNILREEPVSNKFKINSSIQRDLITIQPGILEFKTTTPYQKLIIENKESKTITLPITTSNELIKVSSEEIIIPANSQKEITVYTEKLEEGTKEFITLANYQIPVWVLEGIPITERGVFSFSIEDEKEIMLDKLSADLFKNQIAYEDIFIKNNLNETLTDISIFLTDDLKSIIELDTIFVKELKPNEKITEYFLVNSKRDPKFPSYSGDLIVKTNGYEEKLPITITIIQEETQISEEPEKIIHNLQEEKDKTIKRIEEKTSIYFFITIIGIILLFIIVYLVIPKK